MPAEHKQLSAPKYKVNAKPAHARAAASLYNISFISPLFLLLPFIVAQQVHFPL